MGNWQVLSNPRPPQSLADQLTLSYFNHVGHPLIFRPSYGPVLYLQARLGIVTMTNKLFALSFPNGRLQLRSGFENKIKVIIIHKIKQIYGMGINVQILPERYGQNSSTTICDSRIRFINQFKFSYLATVHTLKYLINELLA